VVVLGAAAVAPEEEVEGSRGVAVAIEESRGVAVVMEESRGVAVPWLYRHGA
jgi:hypothetical protein